MKFEAILKREDVIFSGTCQFLFIFTFNAQKDFKFVISSVQGLKKGL